METPELLAPAGDMESLRAAVANGADAVYLGGKQFNARQYARNFDEKELDRSIRYAHSRNVKVYVTVNILLDNAELPLAAKYLKFLYNVGADAVIIQDAGLLYLARQVVPEMKLHASTQMTVHNLPGARFLAREGVQRIILARELSLEDIREIHQGSSVELEVFVHGALCISYSGQCLMSSLIGGRSGNRGRCAQPCRLPYRLVEEKGKLVAGTKKVGDYLLSPKDLCTIDLIPELVNSGVKAFKFEGRMKKPEYVATVIRVYRQALDRYLQDPGKFSISVEEKQQLEQVFNRDFTSGYFLGYPGRELMSWKRPNNRGVYLGRVLNRKRGRATVEVKLERSLSKGDGVEYWVTKGGRTGTTIEQILVKGKEVDKALPGTVVEIEGAPAVKAGDRLFKTFDRELMERARASFAEDDEDAKIPLTMKIKGRLGRPLVLTVEDDLGNKVEGQTDFPAEQAVNRPLNREFLMQQLGRLGNTPFILGDLILDLEGDLMVPVSQLNKLRRQCISQLESKRYSLPDEKAFEETVMSLLAGHTLVRKTKKPQLAVAVGCLTSLKAAARAGADRVYFNGEIFHSVGEKLSLLKEIMEGFLDLGVKFYFFLPRIWHPLEQPLVEKQVRSLAGLPLAGVFIGNLGAFAYAAERLNHLPIYGDYPLNVFNSLSLRFYHERGLRGITVSPELTFQQLKALDLPAGMELEGLVHGSLPLMVSRHCLLEALADGCGLEKKGLQKCRAGNYGLKDRKNYLFPIRTDQFCRMYIYNPQDLCLLDSLPWFFRLGYDCIRIEAGKEGPEYVKTVTAIYRQALDSIAEGDPVEWEDWKEQLEQYSPQGVTKGHYYRGVL